jgi:hypothetical protein
MTEVGRDGIARPAPVRTIRCLVIEAFAARFAANGLTLEQAYEPIRETTT